MNKKRFCNPLVFILVSVAASSGKNGEGTDLSYLSLYSRPEKIITTLSGNKNDFSTSYIMANAYRDCKKPKMALLYYANSCFMNEYNYNLRLFPQPLYAFVKSSSVKSPYYYDALHNIALILFEYGENKYVTMFADLVKEDDSFLYRDIMILKSKALSKLGKEKESASLLSRLLAKYKDRDSMGLLNIRLGSVYESLQDGLSASGTYMKVVSSDCDSWQQRIAAKRLVFLNEKKGVKLATNDILLLVNTLFETGETQKAREYVKYLPSEKCHTDVNLIRLKILTVTDYNESVKLLKALENDPGYIMLLLEHSNLLWDRSRKSDAFRNYIWLADCGIRDVEKKALSRIVYYLSENSGPDFIPYAERFVRQFPEENEGAGFVWLCGRYYLEKGDYGRASSFFSEGIKRYPESGYTACCRYWVNKISMDDSSGNGKENFLAELNFYHPDSPLTLISLMKEASNRDEQYLEKKYAQSVSAGDAGKVLLYHTLLFIKTGYNRQTYSRMEGYVKKFASGYVSLSKLLDRPGYVSRYGKIIAGLEKYFAAGDRESIARELKSLPENDLNVRRDIDLAITIFSSKYKFYNYGAVYGARLLRDWNLKENLSFLPENLARILYPVPFPGCSVDECRKYGIDPAVVFSVIKAESNFNHAAESEAGALGLMQLIPGTASGIARELKLSRYDLKDPCTSVRFGVHYLAWLDKYYDGRVEYIVSGYNAGIKNVDKWINSGLYQDEDFFIEFIPFHETRDYILHTKKFMVQYKSIYRW